MINKLRTNIAEIGGFNAVLWCIGRGFQRLGVPIRFVRYYFVAQPVPDAPVLGPRRGRTIAVRQMAPGDPAFAQLPLTQDVLDFRFGQNGVCFGAFDAEGRVLGCLWFCFGAYREDEVRCVYRLEPAAAVSWDFDVYVRPEARGGFAFLRLWDDANAYLRSRGVAWSLSRISAFNPGSLAAHARLGARRIGAALFLVVGPLQVSFLKRAPWLHVCDAGAAGPEIAVRAPGLQ
ncbi:MAG: N-acetyltransferase [Alphaproteobacteria bacterium]|nr:N-acetyltransferase [Alphaproteobacteria bacterium]